ncbi:MAG: hypothetical protein RL017_249 [Pseudomonadota bacterium]|jgi:predicted NAD/FAD-binding protein|nr:FAD-dependent oxidoreductase [Burkholderiales bacterium]
MKKIAIIGSGISGLTCGYLLQQKFDIEIFESNNYSGGHAHTVNVNNLAIDTGFIVFNNRTYPNFKKMMDKLHVAYHSTEMSFSVRNDACGLEYNGNNLNALFANRKNLINPYFIKLIYDIFKFNRLAKKNTGLPNETLQQFIARNNFGKWFVDGYILPMVASIWSIGKNQALNFPFAFFYNFFNNHGLLDIYNRPQWYTIAGGSRTYINKITTGFHDKIHLNSQVKHLIRKQQGVEVTFENNETKIFDEVICACNSTQALKMLKQPTTLEEQVLGAIKYSSNEVVLHTDTTLLPRKKLAYASWNYLVTEQSDKKTTLTYNMNILQKLKTDEIYCITLNSSDLISEEKIIAKFNYDHPIFTHAVIAAQTKWQNISGSDRIHYCGAYWGNGFHEDGVNSAIKVCNHLGVTDETIL